MNSRLERPPSLAVFPSRRVLGIDFFTGQLGRAVDFAFSVGSGAGGYGFPASGSQRCALIVAPSAPGLAGDLVRAPAYRRALQSADLALTDSGFMVLLWWLYTGERLPRCSGLKFIRAVLVRPELKQPGAVFWVMPSEAQAERNVAWLQAQGFPMTGDDVYVAPLYPATGELDDSELVTRLKGRRPQVIMLAIGGGVQERLGLALKEQLPYCASILCLGAAIGFLTGGQASIPPWADRLMLGWLLRLLANPFKFAWRCRDAPKLAWVLWRCREKLPLLEKG